METFICSVNMCLAVLFAQKVCCTGMPKFKQSCQFGCLESIKLSVQEWLSRKKTTSLCFVSENRRPNAPWEGSFSFNKTRIFHVKKPGLGEPIGDKVWDERQTLWALSTVGGRSCQNGLPPPCQKIHGCSGKGEIAGGIDKTVGAPSETLLRCCWHESHRFCGSWVLKSSAGRERRDQLEKPLESLPWRLKCILFPSNQTMVHCFFHAHLGALWPYSELEQFILSWCNFRQHWFREKSDSNLGK